MSTRRDFIRKAALLSGAAGLTSLIPESIQRALAINPAEGTTFLDAEHVVILMQENRSFDHAYGSLRGVRGFNDPRAITLPDQNPVWLQRNSAGETYVPFRLNIHDTKATWMGSLPHSWPNQVDARNDGKMDQWLRVKQSGHAPFAKLPLTLGYYTREDLPFYYSLADAFTICDQNFCSSLTGTTPNRLYFWTGTIREAANQDVMARVMNEDADYNTEVAWTTFPERLEENRISWKVYQNEISVGVGFAGEEDAWLANFGDNPLEYFKQYNVRFSEAHMKALPKEIEKVSHDLQAAKDKLTLASGKEYDQLNARIAYGEKYVARLKEDVKIYTPENLAKLTESDRSLHDKAFVTNINDPDYHTLDTLKYNDGAEAREVRIPKGDVLHQFREDVKNKKLPAVSWLVAPENLSDHPSAPWYGAAYLSEAMDILTHDPEVWKKTIFILAYDENDGYFDHVPPFTAPDPDRPETGKASAGIDTRTETVTLEQDKKWRPATQARESSIGLGFRVPLVVASPWSRGGVVNSQVFDHTSVLQFLELFLSHKTGKKITEPNISSWRRAVCGDLTSVFRPYNGEKIALPEFINNPSFYREVHQAQFKKDAGVMAPLSPAQIESVRQLGSKSGVLTRQEKGVRTSSPLPYQLEVSGVLDAAKKELQISFKADNSMFGKKAAGAPFNVYAYGVGKERAVKTMAFAVSAGDTITHAWPVADFDNNLYLLKAYGPNGFFREWKGGSGDPDVDIQCSCNRTAKDSRNISFTLVNKTKQSVTIELLDFYEPASRITTIIPAGETSVKIIDTSKNSGWYDVRALVSGNKTFVRRFAGRIENGQLSTSDPAMA